MASVEAAVDHDMQVADTAGLRMILLSSRLLLRILRRLLVTLLRRRTMIMLLRLYHMSRSAITEVWC